MGREGGTGVYWHQGQYLQIPLPSITGEKLGGGFGGKGDDDVSSSAWLGDVSGGEKPVCKHCHCPRGDVTSGPSPRAHSHLLSGCSFGLLGTMSLAAAAAQVAVFALRCLLTVTIDLAMFYCQFYLLRGCCSCTGCLFKLLLVNVFWKDFVLGFFCCFFSGG